MHNTRIISASAVGHDADLRVLIVFFVVRVHQSEGSREVAVRRHRVVPQVPALVAIGVAVVAEECPTR